MSKELAISVNVNPETQEEAMKVVEVLSRTAAGLALDGISVSLNFTSFEVES